MMTEESRASMRSAAVGTLLEIERSLCVSADIESTQDESVRSAFEAGLDWMTRFVMKPHPELGRKGAVCPFVKPVHEGRRLYFCAIDCGDIEFNHFLEVMMHVPVLYSRIAEPFHTRRDLLSLCLFPMKLPASAYYKFIDCAHSILKPMYMAAGLMIGEFHPMSAVKGAHSDKICPMRATTPFFAIRSIATHDILFVDGETGSPGQRVHELECYLRWTSDVLPFDEVARIRARIDQLKGQLISDEDGQSAP